MDKPATADHDLHDLIASRWSPRAFTAAPVADSALRQLFEAARWAPSCMNEQPWRFIVARRADGAAHARMVECLVPGNQVWAAAAPILVLAFASRHFARGGAPNHHAWHDLGLAAATLTLQATALGLAVHQMAGIDKDKIGELFAPGPGLEPVTALAIGYAGDPDDLPGELGERERAPRSRKPLAELVFAGSFAEPL